MEKERDGSSNFALSPEVITLESRKISRLKSPLGMQAVLQVAPIYFVPRGSSLSLERLVQLVDLRAVSCSHSICLVRASLPTSRPL